MARKKKSKLITSTYPLKVQITPDKPGQILVELITKRIPPRQIRESYDWVPGTQGGDLHPFRKLPLRDGRYNSKLLSEGYYAETFMDTEVVRAITEALSTPDKIRATCANQNNWRAQRARLVRALDLLWS